MIWPRILRVNLKKRGETMEADGSKLLEELKEEMELVPAEGFYVYDPETGEYKPFGRREWMALGATPEDVAFLPD